MTVSSSIVEAVDSTLAACAEVRWARSALPEAISPAAPATCWLTARISPISVRSLPLMSDSACRSCPVSSLPWPRISWPRSPAATARAIDTARASGRVTLLTISQATPLPTNVTASAIATSATSVDCTSPEMTSPFSLAASAALHSRFSSPCASGVSSPRTSRSIAAVIMPSARSAAALAMPAR